MQVAFFNPIHWLNPTNSQNSNIFEEYCAVLPQAFGRSIRHYQQIDSERVVPCSSPPVEKDWKSTAKKIAILFSHLTIIIPLVMYIGKALNRKAAPLQIVSPAVLNPENHQYLEVAQEIRKLRENSHYIPKECLRFPPPVRFKLPVDSILEELDPSLKSEQESIMPGFNFLTRIKPLDTELRQKQKEILAEGFNGFNCVHGVENLKGGIRTVFNIMLEGVLRATWTGALIDGMPEYVAGPHGPYYVILDPSFLSTTKAGNRMGLWSEEAQIAFLVPQEEDRQFLDKGLKKAVERGYITEEEKLRALQKVITYDEFIQLPNRERHSENRLAQYLMRI